MSLSLGGEREATTIFPEEKPAARAAAFVDLDGSIYPGLLMKSVIIDQAAAALITPTSMFEVFDAITAYESGQAGQAANVRELNKKWAQACEGLRYNEVLNHARDYIKKRGRERFYPYVDPAFSLLQERGYDIWLLTGEPPFIAQAVTEEFGATGCYSTRWLVGEDCRFNGKVANIMTSERKAYLAGWLLFASGFDYDYRRSFALIDSANDIDLAETVRNNIVCGGTNRQLMRYLRRNKIPHTVASPENMLECVDELTKVNPYGNKSRSLNRI